ncbi:hypothetical protein K1T71_010450 [Dendrolimus kikuchii]|uniref:Uncharacterized protein n=1 Tax=Dendrolimus kikuchii TaxID=765133 RepID=A0ACC1CRL3_9NEOP|nr:hypothetical protein K1T71_010450 [Dendrolimus kikuchii]
MGEDINTLRCPTRNSQMRQRSHGLAVEHDLDYDRERQICSNGWGESTALLVPHGETLMFPITKIWMAKTKLKGSGVTVSEFLTKYRHDLFMRVRQEFGVSKCWTRDGAIFTLRTDDKRHSISCLDDIKLIRHQTTAMPAPSVKEQPKAPARRTGKK